MNHLKRYSVKQSMFRRRSKFGFSLLEVIIAIFILVMGLSAIMALIAQSMKSSSISSSRLIAANLAQEGIEVVRNIRDINYDDDSGWRNWYDSLVSGDYIVQYNDDYLQSFSDSFLNYNSSSGLYSYNSGTPSVFKRKITLSGISSIKASVTCVVTWTENNQLHSITMEEQLWDWRSV